MSSPVRDPALGAASQEEAAADPHFSLLRLSAGQRLLGAAAILTLLWAAVWWAL